LDGVRFPESANPEIRNPQPRESSKLVARSKRRSREDRVIPQPQK
jgi:hypothetical protein